MPRLAYSTKRFAPETLDAIAVANEILHEYAEQGFDLTLRQLYYQHVARGLIPNTDRSYKRLGSIVNDARLAGYIDWDFIVDRTRNLAALAHWESPAEIIAATVKSYRRDLWADQPTYVDGERWAAAVAREREGQGLLRRAHRGWDRIAESLRINDEEERDD